MNMFGILEKKEYTQHKVKDTTVRTKKVNPVTNNIKDKMAQAFLYGLNSTVNYSLDEAGRDYDGLGVDFRVANQSVGLGRKAISAANELNLQLKAVSIDSTTMIEVTDEYIKYRLSKKLRAIGRHFIFVVVLPEEAELMTWREIEEERLILNCKGYYYEIVGTQNAGYINIPVTNRLDPESFINIFNSEVPLEFA